MLRLSRRWIPAVLAVLLTAGCLASGSNPEFSYQVTGAVERQITGRKVSIEEKEGRIQFTLGKRLLNGETRELFLILPENPQPGTLKVGDQDPASLGYFEVNQEMVGFYLTDDQGQATLQQENGLLNVTFQVSIEAQNQPDREIQITGEVRNLPYRIVSGTFVRQPGDQISPGGGGMLTLVGGGLVCIFGLLILANFVFQFTVGSRVYAGRRLVWLRSLRGTPTFIRGWQNPDLRRLMILWSILLGVLGLLIAGLVILSIPYN